MSSSNMPTSGADIRVMIVDDSAVMRSATRAIISDAQGMSVVAQAADGRAAVERLDRTDVDVIVLDIEMPVMNGLEALPELLKKSPDVRIVMSSTLSERNASISLEALALGAADYIPKPSTMGQGGDSAYDRLRTI